MIDEDRTELVTVEAEAGALHIGHLGFTLRTLLGAANTGYKQKPQRKWNIMYKGISIGLLMLKDTHLKVNNASNERSTSGSYTKKARRVTEKPTANSDKVSAPTALGVGKRPPRGTSSRLDSVIKDSSEQCQQLIEQHDKAKDVSKGEGVPV